jgi:hypothetical protein
MLRRPAVARWRTSAVAGAVLLLATACGHTEAPHEVAATTSVAKRAQLAPTGQQPLTVKGTGFEPGETERVTANGGHATSAPADSAGTFVARLRGVNDCDSLTVVANGSEGSHAEFNLSQIVCIDPT